MSLIRENNLLDENDNVINPAQSIGTWEEVILSTDPIDNTLLTGWTIWMWVDCDDLAKPFKMVWANRDQLKVSDVNTNILLKDVLIELKKLNLQLQLMTEVDPEDHFKN
jgi:hypothetical protein